MFQYRFQALLEVATIFGTRQQRAHIQRIDNRIIQYLWHIVLDDTPGQAFGNSGFANPRLTDQQRVILAPAAQYLDDAFDLRLTTYQGVNFALGGSLVQIQGKLVERRFLVICRLSLIGICLGLFFLFILRHFANTVGNVIHHIEARNTLLVQVIDRV